MRKIMVMVAILVCLFTSLAIGSVNPVVYEGTMILNSEIQQIVDEVCADMLQEHIEQMQRGEWNEIYGGKITGNTKIPNTNRTYNKEILGR